MSLAQPTVLFRRDQTRETKLSHALLHPDGILIYRVKLFNARLDLLLYELVENLEVHLLIFRKLHVRSFRLKTVTS